jgi:inhibitor of KinA
VKISPFGDSALLIQFEDGIDLSTNQKVIKLYQQLLKTDYFEYLIPAYNSLTVGLPSDRVNSKEAYDRIQEASQNIANKPIKGRKHLIPVCYEEDYALDIESIKLLTRLSGNNIVDLHTSRPYHVYMLGFLAGFAYLGQLPSALQCPRKDQPRLRVPKGAVGLAGNQTGIYPCEAPGGWQLIGTSPLDLFDPSLSQPNCLAPGDQVRFRPISSDEFKLIRIKIETGIYTPEFFDD